MKRLSGLVIGVIFLISVMTFGAQAQSTGTVYLQLNQAPRALNPISQVQPTQALNALIFQSLLATDPITGELLPVLAEAVPSLEEVNDTTVRYTFTLRKEARWDNGDPITADDVLFSCKLGQLPWIESNRVKSALRCIISIEVPEKGGRTIVFTCQKYARNLQLIGTEIGILPQHHYDPKKRFKKATFDAITHQPDKLKRINKLKAFSSEFNAQTYDYHDHLQAGSGAYRLYPNQTKGTLILERKADWWGYSLNGTNVYFDALPSRIEFIISYDQESLIQTFRDDKLDVFPIRNHETYRTLRNDVNLRAEFAFEDIPALEYVYLGMNLEHPQMQKKELRQALAALINYEVLNDKLYGGYADRTIGPLLPHQAHYNSDLKLRQYDPKEADKLLDWAGIRDRNGDGLRDWKPAPDSVVTYTLKCYVNRGNKDRLAVAQELAASAKKLGLQIQVIEIDWVNLIGRLQDGDFALYLGAWKNEAGKQDLSAIWHTKSIGKDGLNFVRYGNLVSDRLIEQLQITTDEKQERALWRQFQTRLHDELPYVFLWSPRRFIATRIGMLGKTGIYENHYFPGSLQPPR